MDSGRRGLRTGAGALIGSVAGVTGRPSVGDDVGYFAKDIAQAAVEAGGDFCA